MKQQGDGAPLSNTMGLLSWNCQGLENPWTVRNLRKLVRDQAPTVSFLMETRLDREGFENNCGDLPFQNKMIVKKPNSGGGLALLWKTHVQLDIINYTENHILAKGPWCCIGDFNAILQSLEKLSRFPPSFKQMDEFRMTLDSCNLADLGFIGYKYTWNNKRPGEANIRERLDRAVANAEWRGEFPASTVTHLFSHASDHRPLVLQIKEWGNKSRMSRAFKFEESWLLWEDCERVVSEAWDNVGGAHIGLNKAKDKINKCGEELVAWGSTKVHPEAEEFKELQKKLEKLSMEDASEGNGASILEASKKLDDLLLKQEIYWAQRSRISWLKHGDKNTKYFHSKASQRRRRNMIQGIKDKHNNWVEEIKDIAGVATKYFDNIFKLGGCERMDECLEAVQHKVNADMQEILSREYSADEIKVVLFQMGPIKALEPDGMNALFYKKFWHIVGDHIVGDDVVAAVLDFLVTGNMNPDLNYTHIVLIPKVKVLEKMTDYRPISLCNIMLKQILPQLISHTQSAFVPGRLITNNVLVAYEMLHSMHCRKIGKKGMLALKLDISKAYDRLGFPNAWIERVMTCVSTPSYSVRINGKAFGDPLSPYLFLLCAERFTVLLAKAEAEGRLHGVSIGRRAPVISHLLFEEVWCISDTLQLYAKSSVYFSSNTKGVQKETNQSELGVKEVDRFESYLGLPTLDRVWRKIQGWKGKLLSRASTEVLIKAKGGGMGFRDLRNFNLAILAKQGCFKARYFPCCNFLEALDAPNSSYVWKRCCWRWILNHPTNMVIHPPLEEEWEWRVSDIIDWRIKEWDKELIEAKFHRDDAEAILCMPLFRRLASDLIIWLHTKNGEYSVRSGYHVARELSRQEGSKGESSKAGLDGLVWRHLWKMQIPNKIKVFGWRACQNALPTRENFARCKVVRMDGCGVAQDIWAGSIRKLQKSITGHSDFIPLVVSLIQRLTEEELELFWVLCWTIWNQRNRVIHGGKIQHPSILIQQARDFLAEYKDKQSQLATSVIMESVQQWRPPSGSAFKLNFDVVIFANSKSSGVGVIIRNNLGVVLAGLSARGPYVVNSEEAEVLACRKALEFALDLGFLDLVVEGDNAMVMKNMVSPHPNRSTLGHIYDDIRALATGFRSLSIECIKRSANAVARCLASHASQTVEDMIWLEESSLPALKALYLDVIFLNE
ncbi:hypothetical protein ACB092_03G102900 [Castanea dentata]